MNVLKPLTCPLYRNDISIKLVLEFPGGLVVKDPVLSLQGFPGAGTSTYHGQGWEKKKKKKLILKTLFRASPWLKATGGAVTGPRPAHPRWLRGSSNLRRHLLDIRGNPLKLQVTNKRTCLDGSGFPCEFLYGVDSQEKRPELTET